MEQWHRADMWNNFGVMMFLNEHFDVFKEYHIHITLLEPSIYVFYFFSLFYYILASESQSNITDVQPTGLVLR